MDSIPPGTDAAHELLASVDRFVWRQAHYWNRQISGSDIDDLHQDFVVAILNQAPGYDPARGALTTWANQVCRTVALAMMRKARRRGRLMSIDAVIGHDDLTILEALGDERDEPVRKILEAEAVVTRARLIRRVRRQVKTLRPKARLAVERGFGLTGDAPERSPVTAAATGMSRVAVLRNRMKGIRILRHELRHELNAK
ncbi:hypothetical protein BH11PLA2_BH11PLA2_23280 [soil metagenome]